MGRRISTALLGFVIGLPMAAQAADLPYKAPPPAPVFSWTGIYVGAHGGAAWGNKTFDYNDLTPAAPFRWDSSVPVNGGLAGGQVGLNWQAGWMVLGVEVDGSWSDITGRSICNTTVFFLNCEAKTDGLATATGRLGFAADKALVYVKGGGAWARDRLTISNVALPPLVTAFSSSVKDTRTGWTVGAGIEYMFLPGWSAKVEYDFMDFGTERYNFPVTGSALLPANTFTNWDDQQRLHVVKFGVNYHFGSGPLVARY